jgi:hypothetical protein
VGATCGRGQGIANEVGFVGGGHGVSAGDFDAEGIAGEASIGNGKIDGDEGIRGASIINWLIHWHTLGAPLDPIHASCQSGRS